MRVRWTTDAADDLERICDYIADSRPEAARRSPWSSASGLWKRSRISDGLVAFRGRESVAIYEVRNEQAIVLRLLHGAQRWPVA
jgi:plasmid stabilization system protein ParE